MTPYDCPRADRPCGQLHQGCVGHNRAGGPCRAQPMRGTGDRPRCRNHLGRSAEIVRAEYDAEQIALATYQAERAAAAKHGVTAAEFNPLEALLALAEEITQWQSVCRAMVGQLEEIRYRSGKSGEQVRAEITLYERSLDRSARVLADITRLNIESRLANVARLTADRMLGVFDGVLGDLGHDPQSPYIAKVIKRWLPLLDGKPVGPKVPPPTHSPGVAVELRGGP